MRRLRSVSVLFVLAFSVSSGFATAELRVGAAAVDVSPRQFPVLVNGGMSSRSANAITSPVKARAIVLDDGTMKIGIVVVDSCMMPRPLLDEAKKLASDRTQIPPNHLMISAMWFWNGMPTDARKTTGWLFSNDRNLDISPGGLHLGLGGTDTQPGCLFLQFGESKHRRWAKHN